MPVIGYQKVHLQYLLCSALDDGAIYIDTRCLKVGTDKFLEVFVERHGREANSAHAELGRFCHTAAVTTGKYVIYFHPQALEFQGFMVEKLGLRPFFDR
jgi:hypothetical protein